MSYCSPTRYPPALSQTRDYTLPTAPTAHFFYPFSMGEILAAIAPVLLQASAEKYAKIFEGMVESHQDFVRASAKMAKIYEETGFGPLNEKIFARAGARMLHKVVLIMPTLTAASILYKRSYEKEGKLDGKLAVVDADVASVKKNVASVKKNVASMKKNVASVKKNVATVKKNVASLEGNVASVKGDIASVKGDVASLTQRVEIVERKKQGFFSLFN